MSIPDLTARRRLPLLAAFGGIVLVGFALVTGRPMELFILVGAGLLGLAAVAAFMYLARQWLASVRWTRPVEFRDEPIPSHWFEILHRTFPLSHALSDPERARLLRYVQVFLHEKRFEGCGGLELTEEMKLNIASQACYLLLSLESGCYPDLKTILVYPRAYTPPDDALRQHALSTGQIAPPRESRLGESWIGGTVVVSWDAARRGAANADDGRNVVFHEFAHRLDQQDGIADGVPAALPTSSLQTWAAVVGKHHERLKRARKQFRRTVLNKYGATNRAEFFAVATEAFFEKPAQLRRSAPDLYDELSAFYGRDPATGRGR
jgi:Mlc titration factor MtfA (ptsG expression regulator)